MNRRQFFSTMVGTAGAIVVPWRMLSDPVIVLPPDQKVWISGLEIIQFSGLIRQSDLLGPYELNADAAMIRARTYERALRKFHGNMVRAKIATPMPEEFFSRRLACRTESWAKPPEDNLFAEVPWA